MAQIVNNSQAGEEYLLYQCGTAKPAVNLLGGKIFQIPLTRVAVPDTVPYAFLVRLMLPAVQASHGFRWARIPGLVRCTVDWEARLASQRVRSTFIGSRSCFWL